MRIVILGSEGFVGQHLWRELQDAGHLVSGMDIVNGSDQDARKPSNVLKAIKAHQAEVLVNLASKVNPDQTFETIRDNAGMAGVVAEVCGELDVRLVYGSSVEVYGKNGSRLCHETEGPFSLPKTVYGLVKLWGEQVSQAFAPKQFTSLRFGPIYGPGLAIGNSELVDLLWNANQRQQMSVRVGMDFAGLWVGDAVHAARLAIEKGEGSFNINHDEGAKVFNIAELACIMTAADKSTIMADPRPAEQVVKTNLTKITRLGWEAKMATYSGMQETYDRWVNFLNEDGLDTRTLIKDAELVS